MVLLEVGRNGEALRADCSRLDTNEPREPLLSRSLWKGKKVS